MLAIKIRRVRATRARHTARAIKSQRPRKRVPVSFLVSGDTFVCRRFIPLVLLRLLFKPQLKRERQRTQRMAVEFFAAFLSLYYHNPTRNRYQKRHKRVVVSL